MKTSIYKMFVLLGAALVGITICALILTALIQQNESTDLDPRTERLCRVQSHYNGSSIVIDNGGWRHESRSVGVVGNSYWCYMNQRGEVILRDGRLIQKTTFLGALSIGLWVIFIYLLMVGIASRFVYKIHFNTKFMPVDDVLPAITIYVDPIGHALLPVVPMEGIDV